MRRLALFGAAHGFVLKTILAINKVEPTWDIVGYLDDDPAKRGTDIVGYPVIGDRSRLPEFAAEPDTWVFNNVMGDLGVRAKVATMLDDHGCRQPSLIDPRTDVLDLHHGRGVFVGSFAAFGVSVHLGDDTVVMQAVLLGDETRIGSNVFLANASMVGSRSVVGDHTFVGPNSLTMVDRTIGEHCVIGGGATITKDVPDHARMFGPPATAR